MWRVSSVLDLAGLKPSVPVGAARRFAAGAARGSACHRVLEAHAHGERLDLPAAPDEYTDGIRRWFAEFEPTVLFTERRVVNRRKRLTGRIDLGIAYGGRVVIVDLKRSAPQPWHAIQTAGYADLADDDDSLKTLASDHGALRWSRANLYLPGGGRYTWVTHADPRDPYLFRSALALVQWRYDHGIITKTDPERPDDDADPDGDLDAAGVRPHADYPIG